MSHQNSTGRERRGPTRLTHQPDHPALENLVVFHIGMTIRKPLRVDLWLPAFRAMPRMLAELSQDRTSGMLGYKLVVGNPFAPWVVQYWESTEKLYSYASRPDAQHRPAWSAFNRTAREHPEAVGIWHETFQVARAESIYVGMEPIGLGAITGGHPVVGANERARQRLAG